MNELREYLAGFNFYFTRDGATNRRIFRESPLTVEYPGKGVVRFNAAIRVAIKRYNYAVTWATRHFISLISISKKYESNVKEISKLHLLVVIYECTSGQRKHSCYVLQRSADSWKVTILKGIHYMCKKLEVFPKNALRRILHIFWPNKIRSSTSDWDTAHIARGKEKKMEVDWPCQQNATDIHSKSCHAPDPSRK